MHPSLGSPRVVRDTQWLTLEVCREFVRNKCSRGEDECKFAHPPPQVEVQNCKVICCFDSLLGRCHRIDPVCKYFHPPQHLKEQLSQARRNSVSNRPQHLLNSSFMPGVMPLQNSLVLHNSPSYNTPTEETCRLLESLINPSYLPLLRPARSDRLEVCREFQRGVCSRQTSDCKFAHPPTGVCLDADNYVTVCMDFLKDRCSRETCKYFHPPLHLRSPPLQPPLQQQLYQQQLYQQQQQQQHLLQQLQQQQQHRSSISLPGTSMMANLGTNSSVVAWPVLQNVQTQPNSLVLSLLSLHHQQQQQQQQQQLQQQHQLLQQQLQQQQQQPAMQSLQQQQILNSSLAGLLPTSSFGPLQ